VNDILIAVAADPAQLALACIAAFGASILGGLAGYGTGLVLPVFLLPLVGVVNVVPVMAVAMLFNNGSRAVAFRREIDRVHAWRVLVLGLPAVLVGAWTYTRLPERGVALLIGSFLLAMVALFGTLDALDARLALTGLFVGACTVPGAFVARALLARISGRVHAAFMEVVIVAGAITILVRAW
jgi:uncharacterized protein